MIPIHIKKPNGHKPPKATHYVVARNGLFLAKREWWVEAVLPVNKIAVLEDQETTARFLMPNLPAHVFDKALKVARRIFEISGSEVCLLLHYSDQTGYELTVPCQSVSHGHVKYDAKEILPGHLSVGTIHSHGSLKAYHSSTDHEDEFHWDGVHVTIGDMDDFPLFSLSAEMVVSGNRFPIDTSWFEGLVTTDRSDLFQLGHLESSQWDIPDAWLKRVHHKEQ